MYQLTLSTCFFVLPIQDEDLLWSPVRVVRKHLKRIRVVVFGYIVDWYRVTVIIQYRAKIIKFQNYNSLQKHNVFRTTFFLTEDNNMGKNIDSSWWIIKKSQMESSAQ